MSSKKAEPTTSESILDTPPKGINKRLVIIGIIAGIVLISALGSSIYFYTKYQSSKNVLGNSTKGQLEETTSLIKKVDKLIELPKGENPTIATVSDINKLKGQTFFKNAKNGDKVLIYTKAKKAILYNPRTNKIIEAQPINIGDTAPSASSSASATPSPAVVRVVLLNGTRTPGLATTTEKTLTTSKNITVVSKGNANDNYTKNIVIDLTGKNGSAAVEIAKVLKGEVGKLPATEVKPTNADILVILGSK